MQTLATGKKEKNGNGKKMYNSAFMNSNLSLSLKNECYHCILPILSYSSETLSHERCKEEAKKKSSQRNGEKNSRWNMARQELSIMDWAKMVGDILMVVLRVRNYHLDCTIQRTDKRRTTKVREVTHEL